MMTMLVGKFPKQSSPICNWSLNRIWTYEVSYPHRTVRSVYSRGIWSRQDTPWRHEKTQFWSHVRQTPTPYKVACIVLHSEANHCQHVVLIHGVMQDANLQGLRDFSRGVPQKGEVNTVSMKVTPLGSTVSPWWASGPFTAPSNRRFKHREAQHGNPGFRTSKLSNSMGELPLWVEEILHHFGW